MSDVGDDCDGDCGLLEGWFGAGLVDSVCESAWCKIEMFALLPLS